MDVKTELVQILEDTIMFVKGIGNVDINNIYSQWDSLEALENDLNSHLSDAQKQLADLPKLSVLYAPTAGLCEITTVKGTKSYLNLSSRFDKFYESVKPYS